MAGGDDAPPIWTEGPMLNATGVTQRRGNGLASYGIPNTALTGTPEEIVFSLCGSVRLSIR